LCSSSSFLVTSYINYGAGTGWALGSDGAALAALDIGAHAKRPPPPADHPHWQVRTQ
jgi:hypothetical protein